MKFNHSDIEFKVVRIMGNVLGWFLVVAAAFQIIFCIIDFFKGEFDFDKLWEACIVLGLGIAILLFVKGVMMLKKKMEK